MANPLYTYILNIYMVRFGLVLWHINHSELFNAKPSDLGGLSFMTYQPIEVI